ncbi:MULTISPECIES: XisI protein [unclassified Microcoleus]|uniref:XisI protein n=1 Tax=unclassified Microcoleus TaxID=2642155 RepID=UPI00312BBA90
MDKLERYRSLIQKILEEYQQLSSGNSDVESVLLFDPIREQYLLIKMGWYQDNRIKSNVIHVRLKDGKIWIEEDRTEDGIATDLLQAGVSCEDIVLAFHPPRLRQFTEFATA